MKNLSLIFIGLAIFGLLCRCGSDKSSSNGSDDGTKEEKKEKSGNPFKAIAKMGKEMEKAAEKMEKAAEEMQKAAENTGPAMNYEELKTFLPDEIIGYTKGEPKGGSLTMNGMSYSNAEVNFSNENGDNVHVSILDYSAAFALYTATTAVWALGMQIDTDEEKAGAVKLKNGASGWESYQKKRKKASLTLGAGSRFLVVIEADNQENTDFVKSVAKMINMETLIEKDTNADF